MNHLRILPRHGASLALVLLLGFAGAVGAANSASSAISIEAKPDGAELEVRFKGRKLLVYAFATNQFKPYVRELYTLRGENVLRDAPPDHLHHHGLMYAVCVNDINFWEEKGGAGVEKHVKLLGHSATTDDKGLATAQFAERIHWLAPTNRMAADSLAAAFLVEQRTLTLTVDEENQEVALRWHSRFQVGPKADKLRLHGPNYDGLGLRLPESFNHVARFQNSSNEPYTGRNSQNVLPARWTSVAGVMAGREVMLVMFGRQDNTRGDSLFFTMLDPFAYLSATLGLDKQPLEYGPGTKFSLSYLLTVYSENKPAEFINRRGALWDKERK
jgi:hypothetical protein